MGLQNEYVILERFNTNVYKGGYIMSEVKKIALGFTFALSMVVLGVVAAMVALWLALKLVKPLPVEHYEPVLSVKSGLVVRDSNSSDKQLITYAEDDTDELHTLQPLTYNNQQVTRHSGLLQTPISAIQLNDARRIVYLLNIYVLCIRLYNF